MNYILDLCHIVADRLNGTLDGNFIYSQLAHETNGFTSALCHINHNLGGICQYEDNGNPQPDGSLYYMKFDTIHEFFNYYTWYLSQYDGVADCSSLDEFITCLHAGGYFTADYDEYYKGCSSWLATIQ